MKKQQMDSVLLKQQLNDFMIQAGWTQNRSARGLLFFSPPNDLGINGKYAIALPENPTAQSVSGLIQDAAAALMQVYGYAKLGDLLNRATTQSDLIHSTKIISRFLDSSTQNGAIPLASLSSYVSNMEATLYKSARFQLGEKTNAENLVAKNFAKECFFLQTSVGSFVANIEIPTIVLRQPDLFGNPAVISTEVITSIFAAIKFLNDEILATDYEFDDVETLSNAISLFDVELLNSIVNVLLEPAVDEIDFSFVIGNRIRTTSTGWLSADKRARLSNFVGFITEQLRHEDTLDIVGSIVELRSRDPDGNRNYIRLVSNFHGDRTFITATLNNLQYQVAVDAHRNKRDVRLIGEGIRLKTQVRITELKSFE
jgi:hypothetical protein